MRTRIEMPDAIYHQAKAQATPRGCKLKDLARQALHRVLEAPSPKEGGPYLARLMQDARGVVASGISDLTSNPEHLKGLICEPRYRGGTS